MTKQLLGLPARHFRSEPFLCLSFSVLLQITLPEIVLRWKHLTIIVRNHHLSTSFSRVRTVWLPGQRPSLLSLGYLWHRSSSPCFPPNSLQSSPFTLIGITSPSPPSAELSPHLCGPSFLLPILGTLPGVQQISSTLGQRVLSVSANERKSDMMWG